MNESIDQLLDQIENYKNDFYPKAIELHKDERLRQLVKTYKPSGIVIIPSSKKEGISLHYRSTGFNLNMPKWHSDYDYSGVYYGDGAYYDDFHNFKVSDGRLYAKKKELLDYFPKLKLNGVYETIENKIIEEIKKLDICKSATENHGGIK